MNNKLTIVVPVYNEAEALPKLLPALAETIQQYNWPIILVNDGSSDDSAIILNQFANENPLATIVAHKVNRGYGGALKSGLAIAKTKYVVTFDSDGQHRAVDIATLLSHCIENDADLVIGSRQEQSTEEYYRYRMLGAYRSIGKWLIYAFARLLIPVKIVDINSGFKLYKTTLVQQYLNLCPNTIAFTFVIPMLFASQRHRVLELPVSMHQRQGGVSTVNTRDAIDSIIEILNLCMLINPRRIFLSIATFCSTFGILWSIPFLVINRGVSRAAMLTLLIGVVFFALGLLAEQLAAIRLGQTKLSEHETIVHKENLNHNNDQK